MSRILLMMLMAAPGALLATAALLGPYCGRGAGAVEILLALMLFAGAGSLALGGRHSQDGGVRAVSLLVLLLPVLTLLGLPARMQLNQLSDRRLATCEANLEALAFALDSRLRQQGELPAALPSPLPACPAAGRATYELERAPGAFTILCRGTVHRAHFYDDPRLGQPGYPRYSSLEKRVLVREP